MKFIRNIIAKKEKGGPIKRLVSFVRKLENPTNLSVSALGLLGLAIIGLIMVGVFLFSQLTASMVQVTEEEIVEEMVVEEQTIRHPLTGEVLESELAVLPRVFAMMVENAADAWPLAGVDKGFLVIEAPVEGNIPRFIVFLSEETEVEKLGPIRSTRPYYLDWAEEFGAMYGHVGGSPEALSLLSSKTIQDLDQFYESEYYWRQTTGGRYAPHNVYTSSIRLANALKEYPETLLTYGATLFKTDTGAKGENSLRVDMADGNTYDVTWVFDPKTNRYTRKQGSAVMKMDNGATIEVNNIAVLATDIRTVDSMGRRSVKTIAEGDAVLAQDGIVKLVRWKKSAGTERLRFYEVNGKEIPFNPGKTWIHVVSALHQVSTIE